MKENHIQLFQRFTKGELIEGWQEVESGTTSVGQRHQSLSQERHPGEVSHIQIDLMSLVLCNVPKSLLSRTTRQSEQSILDFKHLGKFGKVKIVEESEQNCSKTSGHLKIVFSSNVGFLD